MWDKSDNGTGEYLRGHVPPAEVSTQCFQNTKLPMLNKHREVRFNSSSNVSSVAIIFSDKSYKNNLVGRHLTWLQLSNFFLIIFKNDLATRSMDREMGLQRTQTALLSLQIYFYILMNHSLCQICKKRSSKQDLMVKFNNTFRY